MRISGFTFIRDGVRLQYPFVESIRSALPLVDEFIVVVGDGDDGTREQIEAMEDPKITIVDTVWNVGTPKGYVYAQQKMTGLFRCTGDWAFYLECDEVLHEQDIKGIRSLLEKAEDDSRVEAVAFNYHHFYGRPDIVAMGPAWYRQEVRIIRNRDIRAIAPDGLFFVILESSRRNRYPRAVVSPAHIFHYGWVRPAEAHAAKKATTAKYWLEQPKEPPPYAEVDPSVLFPFDGEHPAIMQEWLEHVANKEFEPDPNYQLTKRDKKQRFKRNIERLTGLDLASHHFRPVKLHT